MEIAIFRAVQECLSNIHRHSGSTSCSVKIVPGAERLVVEIRDHGRGIPQDRLATLSSSGGVGLRGMAERLRRLGGTLEIQSEKDGTTVTATLPIASKGQSSTDAA